jgi:hypothetical protein
MNLFYHKMTLLCLLYLLALHSSVEGRQSCNIKNDWHQGNNIPRAVILSLNDERYTHTKMVLEAALTDINVTRKFPISYKSEELDAIRPRYSSFLNCAKNSSSGERIYDIEDNFKEAGDITRKVFSNTISFIQIMDDFSAEPSSQSQEEDWLLIFEDDIAFHPGALEPTCDLIEGLEAASNDGIVFLGKCASPKCVKGTSTKSGTEISRCTEGTCAHAWGVKKWKARYLPGAALALICHSRAPPYMDVGLRLFSQVVHPVVFVGGNLGYHHEAYVSGAADRESRPDEDHVGLIYQDRKKYVSSIDG